MNRHQHRQDLKKAILALCYKRVLTLHEIVAALQAGGLNLSRRRASQFIQELVDGRFLQKTRRHVNQYRLISAIPWPQRLKLFAKGVQQAPFTLQPEHNGFLLLPLGDEFPNQLGLVEYFADTLRLDLSFQLTYPHCSITHLTPETITKLEQRGFERHVVDGEWHGRMVRQYREM